MNRIKTDTHVSRIEISRFISSRLAAIRSRRGYLTAEVPFVNVKIVVVRSEIPINLYLDELSVPDVR